MVTLDARVVPVKVPAGAITTFPDAAVINPLAFTVKVGIEVELPKVPTFELTVAKVNDTDPGPVAVPSPVKAVIAEPEVPEV